MNDIFYQLQVFIASQILKGNKQNKKKAQQKSQMKFTIKSLNTSYNFPNWHSYDSSIEAD